MTDERPPYHLLRDHQPEEEASLAQSMAEFGMLDPVNVDEHGNVLDGHGRLRVYERLQADGHKLPPYPRVVRAGLSEEKKRQLVRDLNVARRHLSRTDLRALIADAIRDDPGASDRRLAVALGVSHPTVAAIRSKLVRAGDVESLSTRTDSLGREQPARRATTPPSLFVRGRRDEERARAALAELAPDAPSPSNLLRAEERARMASLARRRDQEVPAVTEGRTWEIRCGDFRDVLADLPDGSVDAIVTDPPYDETGVALFSDLGAFAARVLKPGRLLVSYVGKMAFDVELAALAEHLEWCWAGAVFLPGRHHQMRNRMIRSRWRPVLMFSNGPYEPRGWLMDATVAEGRGEKSLDDHHWQQTLGPFRFWVEQCTRPDDFVVDPFVGGGTTGLACLATGRRFLGCDVDPGAVSLSVERLQAAETVNEGEGA